MALPDYLILGAQRAGTTSLYNWLIQHPNVVPAKRKEVRYFTFHEKRGKDWYGKQLNVRTKYSVHGEAEPNYLFCTYIRKNVKALVPNVKLIVMLRDPVARAFSNWKLMRDQGRESLTFTEAIRREESRVAESHHNWLYHSYKGRGHYAIQLERWFHYFPKRQFIIVLSEKMFNTPDSVFHNVQDFLGLDPISLKNYKAWNKKGQRGLHYKIRDQLREYFKPHNDLLAEMLDLDDMGWGY
jgi:hypothetical protein